jgi:arylsulfatase A-like enzyme
VLDKLDSLGLADRTLVILFSDNGGAHYRGITSNHPLREGKGTLYEGGVRVPLVVRWPGTVSPGSICRQPVLSTDFYPTILELTRLQGDAKHNADLDGVSLMPLLDEPAATLKRDFLCWHYPHYYYGMNTPVSSIRQGDWKLLEYFKDGRLELYNLASDPGEKHDVSATRPDLAKQLRIRLHSWRQSVDAALPTRNPDWKP